MTDNDDDDDDDKNLIRIITTYTAVSIQWVQIFFVRNSLTEAERRRYTNRDALNAQVIRSWRAVWKFHGQNHAPR